MDPHSPTIYVGRHIWSINPSGCQNLNAYTHKHTYDTQTHTTAAFLNNLSNSNHTRTTKLLISDCLCKFWWSCASCLILPQAPSGRFHTLKAPPTRNRCYITTSIFSCKSTPWKTQICLHYTPTTYHRTPIWETCYFGIFYETDTRTQRDNIKCCEYRSSSGGATFRADGAQRDE